MLEKFIFVNHLGQRFEGLPNGVYLNYNDFRDYSWRYDTINSRISRFYHAVTKRKLPLVVFCASDTEAAEVKNRLMDLSEADIEAMLPGRVYIGEYYTNGYVTDSTKSDYLNDKRYCKITLTLTSDDPAWYKEKLFPFHSAADEGNSVSGGIDYPYDYKFDYATTLTGRTVHCDAASSSAFRLMIYGPVENPAITIGGHTYAVNCSVGAGETLLIDSLLKTITLTTASGQKVNMFDKRFRDSYIFEPIPAGQNLVAYSGSFGFDLTVIEKRSEPRWT